MIRKIREYFPLIPRIIIFILTPAAAAVHIASVLSRPFADYFVRYIGCITRQLLAYITYLFPFSVAEAFLLLIPVFLVSLIVLSAKYTDKKGSIRFIVSVASAVPLLYCLLIFGFGTGYYGETMDKKLDLKLEEISAQDLYDSAMKLEEHINVLADSITFDSDGFSVSPHTVRETGDVLSVTYEKLYSEYSFLSPIYGKAKPIVLSEPMTYTHIAGVYTFFTGEININTNFPCYSRTFTIAHEMAHQRGIAREDEANFMAFIVCTGSDDVYIRYCGYMNTLEYIIRALYKTDTSLYREVLSNLDRRALNELYAFSSFFDKYRDSVASEITGTINDTYLTLQGAGGIKSYDMVTNLVVAYLGKKQN
ncbi:MAG: DUF3810 domain-containing protein [Clostridia bacterium]|nr:DUF3810 domain-containing protein [Clostridia bacterium]